MSVAFESNTGGRDTNRIRQLVFAQAQGMWIYNSSSENGRSTEDDRRSRNFPIVKEEDDHRDSSSSSSIGNNSDASGDDDGGCEVQSLFQGSLNNLCDLEDALPVNLLEPKSTWNK